MAKVSVIVPIYNVEKYLKKCIDSLVKQTLQDIEIILVDDGSPDSCPAICDECAEKDERIKVIHKKNAGVSAARNDGLKVATGEYVIFCDSDDWMELNAFEVLYETAKNNHADVVVADINRVTNNDIFLKKLFEKEFVAECGDEMIDELVISTMYPACCTHATSTIGYGGPWNKLILKSLLDENEIKFDMCLKGVCDDRLHNAQVYANAKRVAYVQIPIYNYVLVENSITRSYKQEAVNIDNNVFKCFSELRNQYASDGRWDYALYSMMMWRLQESLALYFFNKKNPKSRKEILTELKNIITSEIYRKALNEVRYHYLSQMQKSLYWGIKAKSPMFIICAYYLRKVTKKG